MKTSKLCALVGTAFLFVGCAQNQPEKWSDFGDADLPPLHMTAEQGGLVFYREPTDANTQAINISVDGEYLTSLLPSGKSQVAVCARPVNITAAYTGQDKAYRMKQSHSGRPAESGVHQITYIRVSGNDQGLPVLAAVTPEEAAQAMKRTRVQAHTQNRVGNQRSCTTVVQTETKYVLDAGALFAFNRADLASMQPQGRTDVRNVADKIKQQNKNIVAIQVIGYTDPVGSEAYNQALSERRADTIKKLLISYGLDAGKISSEGRGKTNLIAPDCQARFPTNQQARYQCNQINRRVEVVLQTQ